MAAYGSSEVMRSAVLLAAVGGALDIGVGLLLLPGIPTPSAGEGMVDVRVYVVGILVLILGGAVLATAVYMAASPMTASRRLPGLLMLAYGVVMVSLGGSMLARMFPLMQGSDVSGTAMIVVGVGMLYSGAAMRKA